MVARVAPAYSGISGTLIQLLKASQHSRTYSGVSPLTLSTTPSPQWSELQERCHLHSTLKQSQPCGQRSVRDAASHWKHQVHRRNLTTSTVPNPLGCWHLTATLISKKSMEPKMWTASEVNHLPLEGPECDEEANKNGDIFD